MASSLGEGRYISLPILSSAAFATAAFVWAYYMRIEEPERVKVEHAMEAGRLNMTIVGSMQQPVQQEAFLPFIEGAVERILAERQQAAFSK
jgi:hypothetical protein